jgi:hypothetical protein
MISNLTMFDTSQRVAELRQEAKRERLVRAAKAAHRQAPASHGSSPHPRAKQTRQRAAAMLAHLLSASDTTCCRRAAFPSLEPHPSREVNHVSDPDRR